MRRSLAAAVLAATALVTVGAFTTSASAVCGGGDPGEACYCPNTVHVPKYGDITLFYC